MKLSSAVDTSNQTPVVIGVTCIILFIGPTAEEIPVLGEKQRCSADIGGKLANAKNGGD